MCDQYGLVLQGCVVPFCTCSGQSIPLFDASSWNLSDLIKLLKLPHVSLAGLSADAGETGYRLLENGADIKEHIA